MIDQLGLLDTDIFVHALFAGDPHRERCLSIVRALQDDRAEGRIDPLVVHEITYVLLRQRQFPSRDAVRRYVRAILLIQTVHVDNKDLLLEALDRWATQGTGFVDAWIRTLALHRGLPVCSVNRAHFAGVPNTFFDAAP